MSMKIYIVSIFLFAALSGQTQNKGVFNCPVMPGPKGVLIYTADTNGRMRRPTEANRYTLYKESKPGAGFKVLTKLSFPASAEELQKRLGSSLVQDIIRTRKLRSIQNLYTQLRAGKLDTLGVFSSSLQVQQALGVLCIDSKQTHPDAGVSYRLDVTSGAGTSTVYQVNLGAIRYTPMPVFRRYGQTASDSVVILLWYAANIHVPLKPQDPRAAFATVYETGDGRTKGFVPLNRQYVYSKKDTLFVAYSQRTSPGAKLSVYMRPEDLAGNQGPASDTFHVLALSFRNVLSVGHLSAMDTMGAVVLHWDSLPQKAWCSGIEVLKSRSAVSGYVALDTLPVNATGYRDTRIMHGVDYYYMVRPVLVTLPQKGRITPAIVNVQTKQITRKPAAPQGLGIALTPGNNIRLHWMPNGELDVFSYYVLRGTSRSHMQVISPPLRDTVFVDSLKGLNSGVTYLYAVAAMNMNMVWGDTSITVGVQSPAARLLTAPGGIMARVAANGVRISFDDVHATDASVAGYVVYRRKKGDQFFTPVTQPALKGTHFTDTNTLAPGVYEYACSSVDAYSHVSLLSPLTTVSVTGGPGVALVPPPGFNLRNTTTGIEISIPPPIGTTPTYVVYRRAVTEKQYHKLGAFSQRAYLDKTVQKDRLYAYTIAIQVNDAESTRSPEKSIRRK
jgi:hypothetical protein